MKSKPISPETRDAILSAVWRLLETGRSDVSQTEIAAAAGVSRQTVFYAFGNRSGLLTAALRWRDETLPHVARLEAFRTGGLPTPERFVEYTGLWLDYLPHVYPVASLLRAAALTDGDAKQAIDDRLVGALLGGFTAMARGMVKAGLLARERADPLAQEVWAATHVDVWRLLVVEQVHARGR